MHTAATTRRRSRFPWLAGGLALAVAVALAVVAERRPGGDAVRDLVDAAGSRRTTFARLTGGFKYGALENASRADLDINTANLPLIAAAGRAQQASADAPTPRNQHAYGVALLLLADYDNAIANLQAAVDQDPANPAFMNDLAVAFAERARRSNRSSDHPRALEYAERALQASRSAEALFTRAASLEQLGLRERAASAWHEYLQIDSASGWANEARQRISALQAPGLSRWQDLAQRMVATELSADELRELCRDVPDRVPELLLGTLLPSRDLAYGSAMAAAYAGATGDDSLQRAMARLKSNPPPAAAMQSLATAYALLSRDRYGDAEPHLQAAVTQLGAATPVLRQWAVLGLGRARYLRGAAEQAERDFSDVIAVARVEHAPSLEARALWVRGVVRFTQGRWALARADYEAAIRAYEAMHDPQGVATVHVNLSILYRFLGDQELVWQHRMAALRRIPTHQPTLAHGFLITTAVTASLERLDQVALLFLDEAVKNATADIPAYTRAETLLQRAKALDRVGRHGEAESDLDAADAQWRDIDDAAVKRRVRLSWLTAAAQLHHQVNPQLAAAEATEAILNARERGDLLRSAELHLYLARALERESHRPQARQAIDSGIRDFNTARASMPANDPIRLSAFEPVWELYDEAFTLQIDDEHFDRAAAFDRYEASRARTLLELRSQTTVTFDDLQTHLPDGGSMVLLQQQPSQLIAWVISRDTDRIVKLPVSADESQRLVEAYLFRIRSGANPREASAALYQNILAPVLEHIPDNSSVVIVIDKPFAGIPWPALVDPLSGKPALTRWSITVSPNASLGLALPTRPPRVRATTALVVSASDVASGLPRLTGARDEARAVAGLYPGSALLDGPGATAARLLERMPSSDVIHISAHAMSSPAYPMLSRIVLSNDPEDFDGLTVRDLIQGARLERNSLVVLAACRTLGSTAIRGEGAIGMAWGFLAAGASTVIATLWDVDDVGIAPVLVDFHRRLLAGAAPADALRAAQLAAYERGLDERIWASLQLIGVP